MTIKEAADKLRNLPDDEFNDLMESWGMVRKVEAKFLKDGEPNQGEYLVAHGYDDGATFYDVARWRKVRGKKDFCFATYDSEFGDLALTDVICYWDLPEVPSEVE